MKAHQATVDLTGLIVAISGLLTAIGALVHSIDTRRKTNRLTREVNGSHESGNV